MKTALWASALLLLAAASGAQSLGEAAQKERQRRAKLWEQQPASDPVDDSALAENPGQLANDPSQPAAARDTDGTSSPRGREDAPAQGLISGVVLGSEGLPARPATRAEREAAWRQRAAQARAKVEDARRAYDDVLRQIRYGQPVRYDENGQRTMYSVQRMKALADEAEAELQKAQAELEALEEEARRAGVPPGWLRE